MNAARLPLLLTACVVFGCAAGTSEPPATPTTTAAGAANAEPTRPGASLAPVPVHAPEGTPGASAGPQLTFTEIRGLSAEQTGITFVPAQERIEECRKSTGGKIVVRLRTENGRVVPDLLPGSSLNPFQQRCVLESLSQTQVPDTANTANGPYIRPTGFTAILTVEW